MRGIQVFGFFLISFLGRFLHSVFVYGAMGILFSDSGYSVRNALQGFAELDALVTNIFTAGIVLLFWRMEKTRGWQEFRLRMEKAQELRIEEFYQLLSLGLMVLLTICVSSAITVYFVHRMDYALNQSGIQLSDANYADLIHLQIQFLIGILSMMMLVIIFLIFNRRYNIYMNHEAKMDPLTGVLNRKTFFQLCEKALEKTDSQWVETGYFMMFDLDDFKEINDQYGHPEGDRALRETTKKLREIFGRDVLIGRIGGDEFAVLLDMPKSRETLKADLEHFLEEIHTITFENHSLSCSIGALPVTASQTVDMMYRGADRLLY